MPNKTERHNEIIYIRFIATQFNENITEFKKKETIHQQQQKTLSHSFNSKSRNKVFKQIK